MTYKKMEVTVEFLWAVHELINAIQRDDTGQMVGGIWMGGNGGMLSHETLVKRDVVFRHMDSMIIPMPSKS